MYHTCVPLSSYFVRSINYVYAGIAAVYSYPPRFFFFPAQSTSTGIHGPRCSGCLTSITRTTTRSTTSPMRLAGRIPTKSSRAAWRGTGYVGEFLLSLTFYWYCCTRYEVEDRPAYDVTLQTGRYRTLLRVPLYDTSA